MADSSSSSSSAPAADGVTKLFVGNLSFKTTQDDLAGVFTKHGAVVSANIITRGPRSLGYGFVEMATLAEAQSAIEALDQQEIDGRKINLEIAKVREARDAAASASSPSATGSPSAAAARKPRPPRSPAASDAAVPAGEGEFQTSTGRGSRRGRLGRSRPVREQQEGGGEQSPHHDQHAEGRGRARLGRSRPVGGAPVDRAPREPREQRPRVESDTTLFVANLPFSVDDAGLVAIFEGLHPVKAHVVRKPNSRSKGFGFVEFDTKEHQLAALADKDNALVEGRPLSVKVALTSVAEAAGEASGASSSDAAPN